MDRRYLDAAAVVKKLKDEARSHPWVPLGVAPPEHYHHFPDGLSLCLTLDVLPREYVRGLSRILGQQIPEEIGEGGKFWHLSIARTGGHSSTTDEVAFWRRAFFEEEPIIEMPGLLPVVNTRHFFWRAE